MGIELHYPRERVISMMMNSGVTKRNEDAIYVGNVVFDMQRVQDPIPAIRHRGFELIKRGIVSVGFFRDQMKHLTKQHGYPSIKFFTDRTKKALIRKGKRNIAECFEGWTDFLYETFRKEPLIWQGVQPVRIYERVREHKSYK